VRFLAAQGTRSSRVAFSGIPRLLNSEFYSKVRSSGQLAAFLWVIQAWAEGSTDGRYLDTPGNRYPMSRRDNPGRSFPEIVPGVADSWTNLARRRGTFLTQNPRVKPFSAESVILLRAANIMNNIVNGVILDIYALLAALCSFRLLFRGGSLFALSYPERVLAFEQSSILFLRRPFPSRLDTPKPGLPWDARPNIRVADFGHHSRTGLVLSSQVRCLETDILFKPRHSSSRGGHSPDNNLPWLRAN
jgi:hypothetical protein